MSELTHAPGNTLGEVPGNEIPPTNTPRNTCSVPSAACGCCEGIEPITPQSTANRPGLAALSYRIGTHSTFLETMKARLSTYCLGEAQECAKGGGTRPLAGLTTRDDSDPSIALLDAWATVGDVLTFYQERIANEGYLRTATERRSVLELSRLVGYNPRPGVSASTYLAYTIDENTKEEVVIPAGARAQSVPGPGELPQSFETSEALKARAAWNRLVPRKTAPQQTSSILDTEAKSRELYLKGIATNLKPNDPLLIVERNPGDAPGEPSGESHLFRVTAVDPHPDPKGNPEVDRTKVEIAPWDGIPVSKVSKLVSGIAGDLIQTAPEGATAGVVRDHLKSLRDLAMSGSETEIKRFIGEKTLPLLEPKLEKVSTQAVKLKPWLEKAAVALGAILRATPGNVKAGNNAQAISASRLESLIKKPSQPLQNRLQLPRKLETSFGPTSDAGLKTLGLASQDLRESLGAAIETYTKASPETEFEVYALRLKAGVFGRNAPKNTKSVTSTVIPSGDAQGTQIETETKVIGEFPIASLDVSASGSTKLSDVLFLDGNYDGILPDSWLVLDFAAVDVFASTKVLVEPAIFPEDHEAGENITPKYLVVQAKRVISKVTRADYGMTGDSTRIDLSKAWLRIKNGSQPPEISDSINQERINHDFQVIRRTAVYAQSERLKHAEAPIEDSVCSGASEGVPLELDGMYQDLEPGRFVIVSGERSDVSDSSGVFAAEAAMITEVVHDVRSAMGAFPAHSMRIASTVKANDKINALPGDKIHTFIRLDKPLSYCYRRESLTIYGNVVKATHGETRSETLGGGDGSKALQTFTLKQPPLTYLAAPTAVGAESTLQVFVNDVRWHEQTSFVDLKRTDHVFITKTDDDDKTMVTFGNGREGARLPTGAENVKALYRFGIGKPGNVRAGQISLLSTRPQGVKEVINPIRASGGADRETRDQARRNAPLAVMSLDRLVSTPDYADFARSFAGIAKADAAELSDGRRTVVHVTVAGTDDIPIDTSSDLYINLRRALINLGDPFQPVRLAARDLLLLVISAGVRIDSDYRWESVVTELRTKLLDTFGFERRALAQDVMASEVLSAMQSVRGVVYVDLDAFGAMPTTVFDPGVEGGRRPLTPDRTAEAIAGIVSRAPDPRVLALSAQSTANGVTPAQLAVLVPELPDTLVLNQIKD